MSDSKLAKRIFTSNDNDDNDNEIDLFRHHNGNNTNIKVLEKCTKNHIGHSRLAFNNHESNIDC